MDSAVFIEKVEKIKMVYRVLILAGTIVLLGGLFAWLIYVPKTEAIEKFQKENSKLDSRINEAKQKIKNIDKHKEDVMQIEEQYKEALTLLPKKEEIPSLLVNITELGTTSNLEFSSFSPGKGPDEHMYTEIPVSIQVKGRYHDVLLFFDRVGKMKRIVNIQNVTMNPTGETTDLNVSCKAITYKFKE
jgi:type IV pilus assembly protein PilO